VQYNTRQEAAAGTLERSREGEGREREGGREKGREGGVSSFLWVSRSLSLCVLCAQAPSLPPSFPPSLPSSPPTLPPSRPPAIRSLHDTPMEGVPRPLIVKLADDKGDHSRGWQQQVGREGEREKGGREGVPSP
jgi:hypothetical protein